MSLAGAIERTPKILFVARGSFAAAGPQSGLGDLCDLCDLGGPPGALRELSVAKWSPAVRDDRHRHERLAHPLRRTARVRDLDAALSSAALGLSLNSALPVNGPCPCPLSSLSRPEMGARDPASHLVGRLRCRSWTSKSEAGAKWWLAMSALNGSQRAAEIAEIAEIAETSERPSKVGITPENSMNFGLIFAPPIESSTTRTARWGVQPFSGHALGWSRLEKCL